jgi:hypothetical protein
MTLNKETNLIKVLPTGRIIINIASIYSENGEKIVTTSSDMLLNPGSDLAGQDELVKNIANVVWTKEIIDAYNAKTDEIALRTKVQK